MRRAIYAGSFNPFHNGHMDIIIKALKLFDELIILVAQNPEKEKSDLDKIFDNVYEKMKEYKNVKVDILKSGLVADYAKKNNIKFLVRSARDPKDYEFELMMGVQNHKLWNELETVLIVPNESKIKIRSSLMPKENTR